MEVQNTWTVVVCLRNAGIGPDRCDGIRHPKAHHSAYRYDSRNDYRTDPRFICTSAWSWQVRDGLSGWRGVLMAATIVEALRKKVIGGRDCKYAAMIGSFIGPQSIVLALVFTGILGVV